MEDVEIDCASDPSASPANADNSSSAPNNRNCAPSESSDSTSSVNIDSSAPSSENSRASDSDSDQAEDEQNVILPAPGDMTDAQKEKYLLDNLKEWGCSGVSKSKLDDLLKRLNPVFPSVPRSYKTLLDTPRTVAITSSANGGEMWYKGIVVNLRSLVTEEYLQMNNNAIILDINMVGLPLFKSSSVAAGKGFWPILGRLVSSYESVFVIGAYCGLGDPKDLWFYLGDFVKEVEVSHLT